MEYKQGYTEDNELAIILKKSVIMGFFTLGSNGKTILGLRKENSCTTLVYTKRKAKNRKFCVKHLD
jgi:hypothetical protein